MREAERNQGDDVIYYVSYEMDDVENATKITWHLQMTDTQNCYIGPALAFAHIKGNEIGTNAVKDLKLDLLTVCDGLIIPEGVNADEEEHLAKLVKMEVLRLENGRLVRPPSV